MMNYKHPLFFYPIVQERIWGGTRLHEKFNKPQSNDKTGESWELSAIQGQVSVVRNGMFHGKSLLDLLIYHAPEVFGANYINKYGTQFPYLFKFIDAAEQLSIQVHPDDEVAQKKHQSLGKNEMWYIVEATPNAFLTIGFKEKTNAETYQNKLNDGTVTDLLENIPVKKGDAFYIPAGTIHAIGGGVLLAEIQQSSDVTYRVFDFNRVDANGNTRELHTQEALEVLNFEPINTKIEYEKEPNQWQIFVQNQHFHVELIKIENAMPYQNKGVASVWMCVEGSVSFEIEQVRYWLKAGETVLIPFDAPNFLMIGRAKIVATQLT